MTAIAKYRVEPFDARDARESVLAFWRRIAFEPFDGSVDADQQFDWLYVLNPAGRGRIYLLIETQTGTIVGCVGAVDRIFSNLGQRMTVALLADFVVDSAHRTLFPAMHLQREVHRFELARGNLIFGMPAPKAIPVFTRLGSKVVGTRKSFVRVIRWRSIFRRYVGERLAGIPGGIVDCADRVIGGIRNRVSGFKGEWSTTSDEAINLIWRAATANFRLLGERTTGFLTWRFSQSPLAPNRVFIVKHRRTLEPYAYFICGEVDGAILVKDFLVTDQGEKLTSALELLVSASRGSPPGTMRIDLVGTVLLQDRIKRARFFYRGERALFAWHGDPPMAADVNHVLMTHADSDH